MDAFDVLLIDAVAAQVAQADLDALDLTRSRFNQTPELPLRTSPPSQEIPEFQAQEMPKTRNQEILLYGANKAKHF